MDPAAARRDVAGRARKDGRERVQAARVFERCGLPASAQALYGCDANRGRAGGGRELRPLALPAGVRPFPGGQPTLGWMIREFEDCSGRVWDVVAGRESWGAIVAIFVPADGADSPRQAPLHAE